ncbi:MAG: DNA polymerase III subunit delta [Campylobacteraceae bacterium]|nr:DNA polymerase III subunit delta [Campylobacteraceae bacterium]
MYKNEFDNILRQKQRNSAYLFYGEADFLIDNYIEQTIKSLDIAIDEVEKIYHDDYDLNYIKNQLSQSSLFSLNNLIVIKTSKKIPKKEMEVIVNAAKSNPDSVVIFAIYINEKLGTHEKLFTPKGDGICVRFFNPKPYEAIAVLSQEANNLGLKYTQDALTHLYATHEENLSLCVNDLKKLQILDEEITYNIISKYCFGMGEVSVDGFLHNLFDNKNINKEIYLILEEGVNEVFLISQISTFIQQLFMINSYTRTHGYPNSKEILGYSPPKDVWEKKTTIASKIKSKQFLEIMNYYNDLELELKTNRHLDSNSYVSSKLRQRSAIFC